MLLQGEQSVYKVFYISGAGRCQKPSQFSKAAVSFSCRSSGISLCTPESCGNTFPIQERQLSIYSLLPELEKHSDWKAHRSLNPRRWLQESKKQGDVQPCQGTATQRSGSGWRCRASAPKMRLPWVAACSDTLPAQCKAEPVPCRFSRLRFLTQQGSRAQYYGWGIEGQEYVVFLSLG